MRRWIGVIAVAVIAVAIVVFRPRGLEIPESVPRATQESSGASQGMRAELLLVANPEEAGESCGCGEIIRMVRGAAKQGVAVREVAPGAEPDLERRYRVTVAPTLLWLDHEGREIARNEGESPAVVDSIRAGLARLASARR